MILPSVAPLTRLAPHATVIEVPHPADGRQVRAAAPWPADLERLIARLDCEWTAEGVD